MKRNASIGMYYLYTFIVCVVIAVLTSCSNNEPCNYCGHITSEHFDVDQYCLAPNMEHKMVKVCPVKY